MIRETTRLEINLSKASPADVVSASTFVIKNRCPAIIVDPDLYTMAVMDRSTKNSGFKIIIAIDFTNLGRNYALDKLRDLPFETLGADGFDILVTPGRTEIETTNELKGIPAFLRQSNPLAEIRWVLDRRWSDEDKTRILECAKNNPALHIRTDINVGGQTDVETHRKDIALIRKHVVTPIKISGNVDYETFKALSNEVALFDVDMPQARAILNSATQELEKQPVK